jgi:hypothetical protein
MLKISTFIFIIVFTNVFSQEKKIFVTSKSNLPVQDVAFLLNDTVRYVTDDLGNVYIRKNDLHNTFKVRHLTHELLEVSNLIDVDTIRLKETTESLEEIILSAKKKKSVSKAISPTNSILSEFGFYKGWTTELEANYATFVSNSLNIDAEIKFITLELKKCHTQNADNLFMPFKVNIYSVDSLSKFPKVKLLDKSILVQKAGSNHLEIDISQYNIIFPLNGIYISVEILSADYYVRNGFFYNVGPSFKYLKKLNETDFYTVKKSLNSDEWHKIESFVYNFGIIVEY